MMPLTEATWDSVNVVFAQLGLDVGPENIAKTAYEMGITSPLGIKGPRDIPCKLGPNCFIPPADAIGGLSVGVTPLEQADAYATLANGGVHHDATAIDRVVFPGGKVDEPSANEGKRVLTAGRGLRGHEGARGRDHQRHRRRLHDDRLPVGGRQDRDQ